MKFFTIILYVFLAYKSVMADDNECPEPNGTFSLGDKANCGQYKVCTEGKSTIMDCPFGLAFNVSNGQCGWPDLVEECDETAYLKFTCPDWVATHPTDFKLHPSPHNESHYFLCTSENRPRVLACTGEQKFNPESLQCEEQKID